MILQILMLLMFNQDVMFIIITQSYFIHIDTKLFYQVR